MSPSAQCVVKHMWTRCKACSGQSFKLSQTVADSIMIHCISRHSFESSGTFLEFRCRTSRHSNQSLQAFGRAIEERSLPSLLTCCISASNRSFTYSQTCRI